ncbi:hypothetical protein ID866_3267 [Astraeus odoratus]|nr:hypothetical protein ID866_3267 [Astraeus odoratus]
MDTAATALAEIRKESLDIYNRIHSIDEDAGFVREVHRYYRDLPLVPNMRCGAWYVDPDVYQASSHRAYFKSTDGHTNNWSFNLRRPNLRILPLILQHGGIVLVDSTRAGKRLPDALSKTVPIWCSVINRTFQMRRSSDIDNWDTALYTPPGAVSVQEHAQIEQKLDAWAADLAASFYDLPDLQRPLRPIWITPATTSFPILSPHTSFYPVVCLSASKQVSDGLERRAGGFAYIQGSGDDHELWSMGLTPTMFWRNRKELLNATRPVLLALVRSLLSASDVLHNEDAVDVHPTPVQHISGLLSLYSASTMQSVITLLRDSDISVVWLTSTTPGRLDVTNGNSIEPSRLLWLQTPEGKRGQHHFLRTVLPQSIPFIQSQLLIGHRVCIACDAGIDAGVGVCIAALALFFNEDGSSNLQQKKQTDLSKTILRTRLQWIISSCPKANPSRTTLKRVNDFLLSPASIGSAIPPLSRQLAEVRERETLRSLSGLQHTRSPNNTRRV